MISFLLTQIYFGEKMKLELIKNSNSTQTSKPESILYDFLKNNLKKDLEVTFWRNKACIIFGEFDFFSDYNAELNSFDYTVSMLFEMPVPLKEDSLEYKISTICLEHFLSDICFSSEKSIQGGRAEELAVKYLDFIVLVSSKRKKISEEELLSNLKPLFNSMVGSNGNGQSVLAKFLNPRFLN